MPDVEKKYLTKLQGLLTKADNTEFAAEAELFRAKATELMAKHRVSMDDLDQASSAEIVTRVYDPKDLGFVKYTADNVYGVCGMVNQLGVHGHWSVDGRSGRTVQSLTFIGLSGTLDMLESLIPTLKLQCDRDVLKHTAYKKWELTALQRVRATDVVEHIRNHRDSAERPTDVYDVFSTGQNPDNGNVSWVVTRLFSPAELTGERRRFIRSWWQGVGTQFAESNQETVADQGTGETLSLVLQSDLEKAKAQVEHQNFKKATRKGNNAGRQAGRNADTGRSGRVTGNRRTLSA